MSLLTASAIRERAPRPVLDMANLTTRMYGQATARWRVQPDFLIVGTKRGGTTSLWNWLDAHPQVLSMFPRNRGLKSTNFFFPLGTTSDWYRSHFHTTFYRSLHRRVHGGAINGEASPYYLYSPHAPRQIREQVPDVRIIVLLRDPVERAYSHFQERREQGVEHLDFGQALEVEEERIREDRARAEEDPDHYARSMDFFGYRHRGVYLPQIERLFSAFPRGQVQIHRSEDLYRNGQMVLDATCDFLELDRHPSDLPRHNEIRRADMDPGIRAELTQFYAPHNRALEEFLGMDFGWAR